MYSVKCNSMCKAGLGIFQMLKHYPWKAAIKIFVCGRVNDIKVGLCCCSFKWEHLSRSSLQMVIDVIILLIKPLEKFWLCYFVIRTPAIFYKYLQYSKVSNVL